MRIGGNHLQRNEPYSKGPEGEVRDHFPLRP